MHARARTCLRGCVCACVAADLSISERSGGSYLGMVVQIDGLEARVRRMLIIRLGRSLSAGGSMRSSTHAVSNPTGGTADPPSRPPYHRWRTSPSPVSGRRGEREKGPACQSCVRATGPPTANDGRAAKGGQQRHLKGSSHELI